MIWYMRYGFKIESRLVYISMLNLFMLKDQYLLG